MSQGKMPELTFKRESFFTTGLTNTLGKFFDIDHPNFETTPYKYRTAESGMRGFTKTGLFIGEAPWKTPDARVSFMVTAWEKAPKPFAVALRGAKMGITGMAAMLLAEAANASGVNTDSISDDIKSKLNQLTMKVGVAPHPADLSKEPTMRQGVVESVAPRDVKSTLSQGPFAGQFAELRQNKMVIPSNSRHTDEAWGNFAEHLIDVVENTENQKYWNLQSEKAWNQMFSTGKGIVEAFNWASQRIEKDGFGRIALMDDTPEWQALWGKPSYHEQFVYGNAPLFRNIAASSAMMTAHMSGLSGGLPDSEEFRIYQEFFDKNPGMTTFLGEEILDPLWFVGPVTSWRGAKTFVNEIEALTKIAKLVREGKQGEWFTVKAIAEVAKTRGVTPFTEVYQTIRAASSDASAASGMYVAGFRATPWGKLPYVLGDIYRAKVPAFFRNHLEMFAPEFEAEVTKVIGTVATDSANQREAMNIVTSMGNKIAKEKLGRKLTKADHNTIRKILKTVPVTKDTPIDLIIPQYQAMANDMIRSGELHLAVEDLPLIEIAALERKETNIGFLLQLENEAAKTDGAIEGVKASYRSKYYPLAPNTDTLLWAGGVRTREQGFANRNKVIAEFNQKRNDLLSLAESLPPGKAKDFYLDNAKAFEYLREKLSQSTKPEFSVDDFIAMLEGKNLHPEMKTVLTDEDQLLSASAGWRKQRIKESAPAVEDSSIFNAALPLKALKNMIGMWKVGLLTFSPKWYAENFFENFVVAFAQGGVPLSRLVMEAKDMAGPIRYGIAPDGRVLDFGGSTMTTGLLDISFIPEGKIPKWIKEIRDMADATETNFRQFMGEVIFYKKYNELVDAFDIPKMKMEDIETLTDLAFRFTQTQVSRIAIDYRVYCAAMSWAKTAYVFIGYNFPRLVSWSHFAYKNPNKTVLALTAWDALSHYQKDKNGTMTMRLPNNYVMKWEPIQGANLSYRMNAAVDSSANSGKTDSGFARAMQFLYGGLWQPTRNALALATRVQYNPETQPIEAALAKKIEPKTAYPLVAPRAMTMFQPGKMAYDIAKGVNILPRDIPEAVDRALQFSPSRDAEQVGKDEYFENREILEYQSAFKEIGQNITYIQAQAMRDEANGINSMLRWGVPLGAQVERQEVYDQRMKIASAMEDVKHDDPIVQKANIEAIKADHPDWKLFVQFPKTDEQVMKESMEKALGAQKASNLFKEFPAYSPHENTLLQAIQHSEPDNATFQELYDLFKKTTPGKIGKTIYDALVGKAESAEGNQKTSVIDDSILARHGLTRQDLATDFFVDSKTLQNEKTFVPDRSLPQEQKIKGSHYYSMAIELVNSASSQSEVKALLKELPGLQTKIGVSFLPSGEMVLNQNAPKQGVWDANPEMRKLLGQRDMALSNDISKYTGEMSYNAARNITKTKDFLSRLIANTDDAPTLQVMDSELRKASTGDIADIRKRLFSEGFRADADALKAFAPEARNSVFDRTQRLRSAPIPNSVEANSDFNELLALSKVSQPSLNEAFEKFKIKYPVYNDFFGRIKTNSPEAFREVVVRPTLHKDFELIDALAVRFSNRGTPNGPIESVPSSINFEVLWELSAQGMGPIVAAWMKGYGLDKNSPRSTAINNLIQKQIEAEKYNSALNPTGNLATSMLHFADSIESESDYFGKLAEIRLTGDIEAYAELPNVYPLLKPSDVRFHPSAKGWNVVASEGNIQSEELTRRIIQTPGDLTGPMYKETRTSEPETLSVNGQTPAQRFVVSNDDTMMSKQPRLPFRSGIVGSLQARQQLEEIQNRPAPTNAMQVAFDLSDHYVNMQKAAGLEGAQVTFQTAMNDYFARVPQAAKLFATELRPGLQSRMAATGRVASTAISAYNLLGQLGAIDRESDTALNQGMSSLGVAAGVYTVGASIAAVSGVALTTTTVTTGVYAGAQAGLTGSLMTTGAATSWTPVGWVLLAAAVVVGALYGFGVIGGRDDSAQKAAEAERARRQREIDAENERRRLEALRQTSIRDIQAGAQSMGKAFQNPEFKAKIQGKYANQLQAFKVKPTYGSRVGMVDIIERELSAQLKPRY